jgi:Sec-independent protein secretion pathway component TatC
MSEDIEYTIMASDVLVLYAVSILCSNRVKKKRDNVFVERVKKKGRKRMERSKKSK